MDFVNARAWAAAHLATHLWQIHRPPHSRSLERWQPAVELLRPGLQLPAGTSSTDLAIVIEVPELPALEIRRRILLLRRDDYHVWRTRLTADQRLAWRAYLAKPRRALLFTPVHISSKGHDYDYLRRAPRADVELADAVRKLPNSVHVLDRAPLCQHSTKPPRATPHPLVASQQ